MITLMTQMVGCLLIAAGIGVAVGWLLRGIPKTFDRAAIRGCRQSVADQGTDAGDDVARFEGEDLGDADSRSKRSCRPKRCTPQPNEN